MGDSHSPHAGLRKQKIRIMAKEQKAFYGTHHSPGIALFDFTQEVHSFGRDIGPPAAAVELGFILPEACLENSDDGRPTANFGGEAPGSTPLWPRFVASFSRQQAAPDRGRRRFRSRHNRQRGWRHVLLGRIHTKLARKRRR